MIMSVSVVHVLWECPAYSSCREYFLGELQGLLLLGDRFVDYKQLDSKENNFVCIRYREVGATFRFIASEGIY